MKSIYEETNKFLSENPDANGLISFCEKMLDEHPLEKTFIQEWCLAIFISKFAEKVYADKVLVSYSKVFVLDTKELGARKMMRET